MEKQTTNQTDASIAEILANHWDYITGNERVDLELIGATADMRTALREIIREETLSTVNRIHRKPGKKRQTFYARYGKRALDILISSAALTATLPVNGVLFLCTLADVGRPVFFTQERSGMDEKIFRIVKFRNMTNATDANGNLLPPKDRVTKFGKIVRKLSLDELLNFWSVLKGDMSIIGPRPLVANYQPFMSDWHRSRSNVRPGLECPMPTRGGSKRSWGDQFDNDARYAEQVSLKLDCQLLAALVKAVFDRQSSKTRGDAMRGSFMGYEKNGESINSMSVPSAFLIRLAKTMEGDAKK